MNGKALPVIEIIPKNGWFDYANKYQANCTQEVCPADIPEEYEMKMRRAAEKAARVLRMEVYCRADFLLTEDGSIYCLEVNTLPGMTPASLLPKEANAAGYSYSELCEWIIAESLKKYN
jgi:D-alanine-D-alanine ligase